MTQNKSKWIRLYYYDSAIEGVMGYEGSIQNSDMLIDLFQRFNIKRDNIDSMTVDGVPQTDDDLDRTFDWYEKKLPDWRKKNEEREKANEEAKRRNEGRKSKSR